MVCRLISAKPSSEPMLIYCRGLLESSFSESWIKNWTFSFKENTFENVVCETATILSRPRLNTLRPAGQNGHHFADNNFKCILLKEKKYILWFKFYWSLFLEACMGRSPGLNSSSPGQNGCRFADDFFKCIFMNEKSCILIRISLELILKGQLTITQHWLR